MTWNEVQRLIIGRDPKSNQRDRWDTVDLALEDTINFTLRDSSGDETSLVFKEIMAMGHPGNEWMEANLEDKSTPGEITTIKFDIDSIVKVLGTDLGRQIEEDMRSQANQGEAEKPASGGKVRGGFFDSIGDKIASATGVGLGGGGGRKKKPKRKPSKKRKLQSGGWEWSDLLPKRLMETCGAERGGAECDDQERDPEEDNIYLRRDEDPAGLRRQGAFPGKRHGQRSDSLLLHQTDGARKRRPNSEDVAKYQIGEKVQVFSDEQRWHEGSVFGFAGEEGDDLIIRYRNRRGQLSSQTVPSNGISRWVKPHTPEYKSKAARNKRDAVVSSWNDYDGPSGGIDDSVESPTM